VLLGGGVVPVVCGFGGLVLAAQADLLTRDGCHQSVDRHASETHADGGYDGDLTELFRVTYFSSVAEGS